MSTFKQKSLFAALAGLGVLGIVDSAQAVHINADGLGQAMVYPYFTARSTASGNAYVTALSVVNTTASAKAVKVRFLEGKNSREVLDFNLYLSHHDVWVTAVIPTADGAGITFTSDRFSHMIWLMRADGSEQTLFSWIDPSVNGTAIGPLG